MWHGTVTGASILVSCLFLCSCSDDGGYALEGETRDVPSWAEVSDAQLEAAKDLGVEVAFENDLGMRFVLIPAGEFAMGSPEDEEGHVADEGQLQVTIPRPFYMQTTEVTNGEFRRFRPSHPELNHARVLERLGDPDALGEGMPAVYILPDDADSFCTWMSSRSHRYTYRVPTEEEWEYACRAGTKTAYSTGGRVTASDANFDASLTPPGRVPGRFTGILRKVGAYAPNDWGLYDMHGNVTEWCQGELEIARIPVRRARGGGWASKARSLRSAARLDRPRSICQADTGFRVVAEFR